MRLTLRTMLAYLDDILEPDDTEDIGKKIEESEFATNLVHRTRDCMRRLRLGVPAIVGRGLGADPNSVAEYLDNTLAPDRVGEFEKVCLESDVHLAEVASCHQILTLVLGEPAEIDPESRERAYGIAALADAPPVQDDALRGVTTARFQAAPNAPPIPTGPRRPKPEVPEYLRESRSRLWPAAAMVSVAALLTFGALMAFGPAQLRQRVGSLVLSRDEPVANDVEDKAPHAENAETAVPSPAEEEKAPSPVEAQGAGIRPTEVTDRAPTPVIEEPAPAEPSVAATPSPPEPNVADRQEPPADSATTPAPTEPAPAAATPNAEEMPADAPDEAIPAAEGADKPAADDGQTEREATESEAFGRFMSKHDVLLKFDEDTSQWNRLESMAPLAKSDRLLSLPLFRPMMTLSSSLTIQAQGSSLVELVEWVEPEVPVILIEYGRVVVSTAGKPDNSIRLRFADQEALLTLVDADAAMAVEVRRVLTPGKDPETETAPTAVDLYATSGVIRVGEGDEQFELQAPAARALRSVAGRQPSSSEFPKWVNSETLSGSERQATTTLEPLLKPGEPVLLTLTELADGQHQLGKRRELRALAMRSLAHLGEFEPCVKALNDPKEKLNWDVCLDELQEAVARSPETAGEIRAAFVKLRAADAPLLFRMLWGYSSADLKSGGAKDLVEGLNHDSLDFRVVSFWNLQNIAGPANHGYHPDDTATKRKTPYNAWKEKLRQGKIGLNTSGPSKGKSATAKGG